MVTGPKLRKSVPLARLEVRRRIALRAAHPLMEEPPFVTQQFYGIHSIFSSLEVLTA